MRRQAGTVGVLISGGLDSSILLAYLLRRKDSVRPFYVQSHLVWEAPERMAVERYLAALASPRLQDLVTLELPLRDLYADHWSITGENTPGAASPDEAVFLPGRNALLVIKAALWCQLHAIRELALAPLGTSPFADAASPFFEHLEAALNQGMQGRLRIVRPFASMTKREVMQLGHDLPLHLTFSCIAPRRGIHCGHCNKCAERREAFRAAAIPDPTRYGVPSAESDDVPSKSRD